MTPFELQRLQLFPARSKQRRESWQAQQTAQTRLLKMFVRQRPLAAGKRKDLATDVTTRLLACLLTYSMEQNPS